MFGYCIVEEPGLVFKTGKSSKSILPKSISVLRPLNCTIPSSLNGIYLRDICIFED